MGGLTFVLYAECTGRGVLGYCFDIHGVSAVAVAVNDHRSVFASPAAAADVGE